MTGATVEIVLKDDHGRNLINVFPAAAPVKTHLFEMLLGFEARKPFIPKDDRQTCGLAEFFRKPLYLFTLGTGCAIHMKRLANHDLMHLVLLGQAPEYFDVGFQVFSPEGRSSLCGEEKCVADGDADGFIANVESHNPHIFHDTIHESSSTLGGSI